MQLEGQSSPRTEEMNLVDALSLDFWPPEIENNKYLLFKLQGLRYFIMAAALVN